jgi:hypothetical protein
MATKKNAKKTKAAKAASKTKKSKRTKPEQMKIPGTERIDRIEEIEEADKAYIEKRDERMALQEEENDAQDVLTAVLKKHNKLSYKYEGPDGKPREAYLPTNEVKAKSRVVKEKKKADA